MKKSKCPFANLFGEPGAGIHSWRILGLAGADVLLTIAAAYFISAKKKKSFGKTLFLLIGLGIILHRMFGVNTALNEFIFQEKICK